VSAQQIAETLHRLCTGDRTPPRPWAYLSHLGITAVSPLGWLQVGGFTDQAGFELFIGSQRYRIMVSKVADDA
jgi:hypothetical protein